MKANLTAAWLVLALAIGASNVPSALAQPPGEEPVLPPKVMEFLQPATVTEDDSPLLSKQKERLNTAVKLLEGQTAAYRKGLQGMNPLLETARLVARFRLEMARSPQDQLLELERALAVAELIEQGIEKKVELSVVSRDELVRAQITRMTVEVEILKVREQLGETP